MVKSEPGPKVLGWGMRMIRAGLSGTGTGKAARNRVSPTTETSRVTSACLREFLICLVMLKWEKKPLTCLLIK